MSIELTESFELMNCASCGVAFAIPSKLEKSLRESHRNFYCPNGHTLSFFAVTEAERLREELQKEKARTLSVQTQLSAQGRELNRLQRRISRGVCPCCNRTFPNLAAHMKSKHKESTALIQGRNTKQLVGTVQ